MIYEYDAPPTAYFELFDSQEPRMMLRFVHRAFYFATEEEMEDFLGLIKKKIQEIPDYPRETGDGFIFWRRRPATETRGKSSVSSFRLSTSPSLTEDWVESNGYARDEAHQYRAKP